MAKMRAAQITGPNGPVEIVEPEGGNLAGHSVPAKFGA
jgi:hypothetical protein